MIFLTVFVVVERLKVKKGPYKLLAALLKTL